MLFLFFVVSLTIFSDFQKVVGTKSTFAKSSGGMSHLSHPEITHVQQSLSRNYPPLTWLTLDYACLFFF